MADHSPTSASSMHRWENCPGSVALIQSLGPQEREDSPAAAEGTAAHEGLAKLLANDEMQSWELIGQTFNGIELDAAAVEAIEVGAAVCRSLITPATEVFIEQTVSHPKLPGFRGTVDFASVTTSLLNVVDYKHGIGVVVEVENNPQAMYYAYGLLLRHPTVRRVVLRIVQPRAHHPDGPVRRWETSAEHICEWAERTLIPAIKRTETDGTLDCGDWCRFCPAKLVCPMLTSMFEAAATYEPGVIGAMANATLGQNYKLSKAVKFYLKAIEDETFRRNMCGLVVPGTKLVNKRADRVFRSEAEALFVGRFGEDAMEPAKLKSPAQMEKISATAKKLVHEHAYTPESGYTLAAEDDTRPAVKLQTAAEVFGKAAEKLV